MREKIVEKSKLLKIREEASNNGKIVVWTNGCFDLFHVGHARILSEARSLGDLLIVGVNQDEVVRQLKGPGRPVIPEDQRAELVASLECVDYVLLFDGLTPEKILSELRPDLHCKGGDYSNPSKSVPERETIESYGGKVKILKFYDGLSTTDIVNRIKS